MRNESWLRLMSGVVLVAVFAAGALFGAGVMRFAEHRSQHTPSLGPPPGGPIEAMTRELALDGDQRSALRTIADAHRRDLEEVGRVAQGRVRDILFAIEDELRPRLRRDQVQRLETWRAHRGPPPPPPGLPPPPPPPAER
jgi:hypothetical protein